MSEDNFGSPVPSLALRFVKETSFQQETIMLITNIESLKVLLRRNLDVMFITKNHLYQLINEDCHLKFD